MTFLSCFWKRFCTVLVIVTNSKSLSTRSPCRYSFWAGLWLKELLEKEIYKASNCGCIYVPLAYFDGISWRVSKAKFEIRWSLLPIAVYSSYTFWAFVGHFVSEALRLFIDVALWEEGGKTCPNLHNWRAATKDFEHMHMAICIWMKIITAYDFNQYGQFNAWILIINTTDFFTIYAMIEAVEH